MDDAGGLARLNSQDMLASLARLWPNRTHEANWMKQLLCSAGLHRWHSVQVPWTGSTLRCRFCRWCPRVRVLG
jgi:hypothetical protein